MNEIDKKYLELCNDYEQLVKDIEAYDMDQDLKNQLFDYLELNHLETVSAHYNYKAKLRILKTDIFYLFLILCILFFMLLTK